MDKPLLTPGKLYAHLSAEFDRRKPRQCRDCRMPMVVTRVRHEEEDERPNWTVEAAPPSCRGCEPLIEQVVRMVAAEFDVFDPTAARLPPAYRLDGGARRPSGW